MLPNAVLAFFLLNCLDPVPAFASGCPEFPENPLRAAVEGGWPFPFGRDLDIHLVAGEGKIGVEYRVGVKLEL